MGNYMNAAVQGELPQDDDDGDVDQERQNTHSEQTTAHAGSVSDDTVGRSAKALPNIHRKVGNDFAVTGATSSRPAEAATHEDANEDYENAGQVDDYEVNYGDEEDDEDENDEEENSLLRFVSEQPFSAHDEAAAFLFEVQFQDFVEGIEPFFVQALKAIKTNRFNLEFAKDFVMKLRALGQRKEAEGFHEQYLENVVVNRALGTVFDLVNTVNTKQEELYDPRQTLAYLYCGMSVFTSTVRLGKRSNLVVWHLSPAGNVGHSQVPELIRYCALKAQCENSPGWKNVVLHYRFLLDLAAWLDVDRPAVSHLIVNKLMPGLGVLVTHTRQPGIDSNISFELNRLWEIGIVVAASALVRCNLVKETKDLYRLLLRVDTSRLPATLAGRHAFVHAKLLQNCGEFGKALERANEALKGVTDKEEKNEIENLIQQLNISYKDSNLRRYGPAALDERWLSGAHIVPTATRTTVQDAILETHRSRSNNRGKKKAVPRRGESPSPGSSAKGSLQHRGSSSSDLRRDTRDRLMSTSSMPDLAARSRQRMNSASSSVDTASESGEDEDSLVYPSDLDDSEDDDEDVDPEKLDRDILFVNDYLEEDDVTNHRPHHQQQKQQQRRQQAKNKGRRSRSRSSSRSSNTELVPDDRVESEEEEIDDQKDWFEVSVEANRPGGAREDEDDTIELSENQDLQFNKPVVMQNGRQPFYPNLLVGDKAVQLLKSNPSKYKRCQLKVERSHKSIARVLDKDKYTEILIEGRSKANRCYNEDEVVVEILAEPDKNRTEGTGVSQHQQLQQQQQKRPSSGGLNATGKKCQPQQILQQQQQRGRDTGSGGGSGGVGGGGLTAAGLPDASADKMVHGKVVGLLKRVNYAGVQYPVLFCTLDEIEGHLMRPLCKTVPKIHILHEIVKRRYPNLKKHRVEIKQIKNGEVVHKRFCDVLPSMREQYVFKVVILGWRQSIIYPLGAVLDAHPCGRKYAAGLKVLSMKQNVPKFYPRAAVEETKLLIQQTDLPTVGRQDLSGERIFTIDPPGSRDLDDAIGIKKVGQHYLIGVHIADVAAVVIKDSAVDLEARRRAVTFYPLDRKPHPMLPEPLSHDKCSLLPGQKRLAISVFFKFDAEGKQVSEPEVQKTIIKSCKQLTYEEVQKVIDGDSRNNVEAAVRDDILLIHIITSKLREARQKASMFFVPFDDPRLPELVKESNCIESHSLIEELMVSTNTYIAKRLIRRPRFQNVMLVRIHKPPTWEELAEWQEKEGNVTNLVLQLQEKSVTPNRKISLDHVSTRGGRAQGGVQRQETVVVQSEVWVKLCQHLENGEVNAAKKIAFADSLHPLQCLAASHWMDLMETAEYKCYHGLNVPEVRHFGLDVDVYCHFTSPIRRYADLHIHRLLHADLDGRTPDCTVDEVVELSHRINGATSRQRAFGKGCLALKIAESLQKQPLVFRAFVDKVDTEQLTVVVPSLLRVPDRKQELPFNMLGVSSQPELMTDTVLRRDRVTVAWKRRVYDEKETCPSAIQKVWERLEKRGKGPKDNQTRPDNNRKTKKSNALILYISPDQQMARHLRLADWAHIVKTLAKSSNARGAQRKWREVGQKHR